MYAHNRAWSNFSIFFPDQKILYFICLGPQQQKSKYFYSLQSFGQRKSLTLFEQGRDTFITVTVYHLTKPSWNRVKVLEIHIQIDTSLYQINSSDISLFHLQFLEISRRCNTEISRNQRRRRRRGSHAALLPVLLLAPPLLGSHLRPCDELSLNPSISRKKHICKQLPRKIKNHVSKPVDKYSSSFLLYRRFLETPHS